MNPVIELRNVDAGYHGQAVLRNVSLAVMPGDSIAVIGPNGGGKTTMLRVICRALRPAAGRVLLQGRDAASLSQNDVARIVGLVPQVSGTSGFEFTVEEAVLMGRYPHLSGLRRPGRHDLAVAEQAMQATGITELRNRLLGELSGGEAQRVYIARSIAQQPAALLLDEPTTHLDLGYQAEIMHLLRGLNDRGRGLTVVAVLHDLNLALQYFDRFLVVAGGQIAATGGPATIDAELLTQVYGARVRVERRADGSILRVYAEVAEDEDRVSHHVPLL